MSFKNGIIPKGSEANYLRICKKCNCHHFYYGTAFPEKNEKCIACKIEKENKKGSKKRVIKRNPRIIKRN